MAKEISKKELTRFEQIKKVDASGNEYWNARDLAKVLEYSEYRHFVPVIERAKEACINSKQRVEDHYEDILVMIELGKGAKREVDSVVKIKPNENSHWYNGEYEDSKVADAIEAIDLFGENKYPKHDL